MYSINLHIQATDGDDLRRQLRSILGAGAPDNETPAKVETKDAEPEAETVKPTRTRRAPKEVAAQAPAAESAAVDTDTDTDEATTDSQTEAPETGKSGDGAKTADTSTDSDRQAPSSSTSAADTASDGGSDGDVTIDTIRELTLSVVDKRGKEGIESVLSEFGVARSTQVPEAQWGELAQALRDALED